jgi:hypothetical protein
MRFKEFVKQLQLFTLFLLFLPILAHSQGSKASEPKKFSDKFFYGGALGLTVGSVTQVDIIPVAGIWVIPQWSIGVGGRYSYYSQKAFFVGSPTQTYRSHMWGGSVFTQILPIPDLSEITPIPLKGGLFFHGEYETLYIDRRILNPFDANEIGKTWVELWLVGFGFRQKIGEKAALNIMLLWEISNSSFSPYPQNPMLRVNFTL